MKYVFATLAMFGFITCVFNTIFHLIDKDFTGAMTWILAMVFNMIGFTICVVAITEENHESKL